MLVCATRWRFLPSPPWVALECAVRRGHLALGGTSWGFRTRDVWVVWPSSCCSSLLGTAPPAQASPWAKAWSGSDGGQQCTLLFRTSKAASASPGRQLLPTPCLYAEPWAEVCTWGWEWWVRTFHLHSWPFTGCSGALGKARGRMMCRAACRAAPALGVPSLA